jgi:hypothetical protein
MGDITGAFGALYIWDGLEKRGFPVTDDVQLIDIDGLTWEQKKIIVGGNELEIDELVKAEGGKLSDFVMMGATVFTSLMQAVFENESEEKRLEISNLVKNTLRGLIDRFEDDSE